MDQDFQEELSKIKGRGLKQKPKQIFFEDKDSFKGGDVETSFIGVWTLKDDGEGSEFLVGWGLWKGKDSVSK